MFGLEFLFSAALYALPLVGLPVLLHLLFRRKSPVILFPTLRFIRSSLQQTAARRKVQRWLLLACRMLLILLLIWAVAQPVRMLASSFFSAAGKSQIAAIVIDTSYSMELQDKQTSRLDAANAIVEALLRDHLKEAQVAIVKSLPGTPDDERLQSPAAIQSQWTPLKPQPGPQPLIERVRSALDLLNRQDAGEKWLIILTDLQAKEFPRPLAEWPAGRVIFFDLHPDDVRSAAVTQVAVQPEQPIPGIKSEAVVEITGRNSDSRALTLQLTGTDAQPLDQPARAMAHLDGTGKAQVRLPLDLPAQNRWMLLTASLPPDDAFAWAGSRSQLIEVPPRQVVTFIDAPTRPDASRFFRLALDPSEGKQTAWPLDVRPARDLTGREQAVVLLATDWPDVARATRLREFVRGGGTLVLALQPGLEETWPALPDAHKQVLLDLLPGAPASAPEVSGGYRAALVGPGEAVMRALSGKEYGWETLRIQRFVPLPVQGSNATPLLSIAPVNPAPGARPHRLLFRKTLGAGTAYTLSTLPDITLATHPTFLPLVVSLCLRPPAQAEAQNVELGQPLILAGPRFASVSRLELEGPQKDFYVVNPTADANGRRFTFDRASAPGLYTWRLPPDSAPVAITNVQLPSSEADLTYRDANTVVPAGPSVLVARSMSDLQQRLAQINEPEPRWIFPLSIVLFLLCLEALMGSLSQLWKPIRLRSLLPGASGG